jgi:hypothetical protein
LSGFRLQAFSELPLPGFEPAPLFVQPRPKSLKFLLQGTLFLEKPGYPALEVLDLRPRHKIRVDLVSPLEFSFLPGLLDRQPGFWKNHPFRGISDVPEDLALRTVR